MPNEIPDSEDESDLEHAPLAAKRPAVLIETAQQSPILSDRGLNVNFDDFISQSQSAKETSSQLDDTKRSTASTQKHLREALDERRASASSGYDGANDVVSNSEVTFLPPVMTAPRKRAHSEVDGMYKQGVSSGGRNKRARTYGSVSRRHGSSHKLDSSQDSLDGADAEQTPFPSAFAARSSSQAPDEQHDDEEMVPRARNWHRKVAGFIDESVRSVDHVVSTSSIGGYRSINLDFRGSGLDTGANPFGTLSQVSVDLDDEGMFESRPADRSRTVPLSESSRPLSREGFGSLTDDLPLKSNSGDEISVNPSLLVLEPPNEMLMLTSPVATRAAQVSTSTFATSGHIDPENFHESRDSFGNDYTVSLANATAASIKKSHSSIDARRASVKCKHDEMEEPDEPAVSLSKEQSEHLSGKLRGSTVEPEPHSEPADEETLTSKKKKGRKESIKSTPKPTEQSPQQELPTSELNLSDEATIGLPKENYEPRPSRRRSRIIVEDEKLFGAETNTEEIVDRNGQPEATQQFQSVSVEVAPTPKLKKGKKAKVKRAKTSAAGLLKKSEPMISDGEEDVVWMDAKPAKVKLDMIPDPLASKLLKEEDAAANETLTRESQASQNIDKDNAEPTEASTAPKQRVTVEIPARIQNEPLESKKQGRKRNIMAEVHEDQASAAAEDPPPMLTSSTEAAPASPQRSAHAPSVLAERDINTCLPPPTPITPPDISSPPTKATKTTHSPINPIGGKVLYRVGLSRRSAIPPLLKIVKPQVKQQKEKENVDEDAQDLVEVTMKKWRALGVLD